MNIESFSDIVRSTNTPMALAALSILVIGSVVYANIKGKDQPTLIRYGFGLSALFGILAIIGFFFDGYNNQIFLAEGMVVGEDNKPIDGAYIDMYGSGRSVSISDGSFKVPIFRKLAVDSYDLKVQKPGYSDWISNKIKGPYPPYTVATMKPKVFTTSNIVVNSDIQVGIYLGVPEIYINFMVQNDTTELQTINGILARLESPTGQKIDLFALQIQDINGIRPFNFINVPPFQEQMFQVVFADGGLIELAKYTADQSGVIGHYGCFPGAGLNQIEDNEKLEQFFDENFRWVDGLWKVRLSLAGPKKTIQKTFTFSLSNFEMAAFKAMRKSYKQCAGLLFANHYVSNGPMKSMSVVSIEDLK